MTTWVFTYCAGIFGCISAVVLMCKVDGAVISTVDERNEEEDKKPLEV